MSSHTPSTPASHRTARLLGWVAVVAVLLAVFALYTAPGFMVMLADQLWACF
ncbi:conserved hypothetical protein [Acidovorax delafieldii 2AN]|uniref:Uncharacterized protein n=1 Tax=Acidovorax delafieldii 2AN TaxID=573060 RepID=C5T3X0_ACIDE|nr:hypothetical protein [Acidovorax delafieldii]EER60840.1 conserved hypothetical protein [Acidovorax delafieldii 2AN]